MHSAARKNAVSTLIFATTGLRHLYQTAIPTTSSPQHTMDLIHLPGVENILCVTFGISASGFYLKCHK
jgi:hypothetical protein